MLNSQSCLVVISLVIAKEYEPLKTTLIADLAELDLDVSNSVDGFIVNALLAAQQYDGFPSDYNNAPCFANDEVGTEVYTCEKLPQILTKDQFQMFSGACESINVKSLLTREMAERLCEYFNMLEGNYTLHSKRITSITNTL